MDLSYSKEYCLYDVDGLNPVAGTINTTEFATGNGAMFNSYRIGTRNIVLYVKIYPEIEKNRLKLYQYFKINSDVTLYFRHESLDVYIVGKVESFELDHFSNSQVAQISIICADPFSKIQLPKLLSSQMSFRYLNFLLQSQRKALNFLELRK